MGADENVAIMQRAYDAFNRGDLETLTEIFDGALRGTCRGGARWPRTTRAAMRSSPTSAR